MGIQRSIKFLLRTQTDRGILDNCQHQCVREFIGITWQNISARPKLQHPILVVVIKKVLCNRCQETDDAMNMRKYTIHSHLHSEGTIGHPLWTNIYNHTSPNPTTPQSQYNKPWTNSCVKISDNLMKTTVNDGHGHPIE